MKNPTIQNLLSASDLDLKTNLNPFQYPLEIWYKRDLVLPGCRPAPLLMHASSEDTHPELRFWNVLREKLRKFVKLHPFDDLSEAGSLVVTPNDLRDYTLSDKFLRLYAFNQEVLDSGRMLMTFAGGTEYNPLPGEIVFASSSYSSGVETCIPTPLWLFDLKSKISPIEKPSIPTVGFVGDTSYPGGLNTVLPNVKVPISLLGQLASNRSVGRNLSLRMRRVIARHARKKIVEEVRKAPQLKTTIIERDNGYFSVSEAERECWRQEYLDSIQKNAYTLCMRGDENACNQIYEVLSAGRIPIIIDTNIQLPELDGFGSWHEFSVLVPFAELPRIGEIVQEFHNRMSEEEFEQTCAKARAAYEYLLPHNFIFSALNKYFVPA
jgi:Exostosin family